MITLARSENQKVKILHIAQYFQQQSDPDHYITAADIIAYLEDLGIEAERRSVYRDIYALRDIFGMDIDGGQGGRFRLMSRQFDFEELQLIAECIYATKFISDDKARSLINTLTDFCSEYQAEMLERETFLTDRVKTTNESTLRNIGKIRAAMATKKDGQLRTPTKIRFKYMHYRIKNHIEEYEGYKGNDYVVSPYKILLNDGNMYLIGYSDRYKEIRHYRIDKMKDLRVTDEARDGGDLYNEKDMENYAKRVFSMFSGETVRVEIRFDNRDMSAVIEKFGTDNDVFYSPVGKKEFSVIADVEVSKMFFGWLCGFGSHATILYPPEVVEDFKHFVNKIQNNYIETEKAES